MNVHRIFSIAIFGLAFYPFLGIHEASAATCTKNVKKCEVRCEIKNYGNGQLAEKCQQNCTTAYNACVGRNDGGPRPMPMVDTENKKTDKPVNTVRTPATKTAPDANRGTSGGRERKSK